MGCVRVCAVLARAGALCFAPDVEKKNTKFKLQGDAAHNDQAPEPLGSNNRCAEEREPERERADVARERDNPPRGDVQLKRGEAGAAAALAQRHEQSPPRNIVRLAAALARVGAPRGHDRRRRRPCPGGGGAPLVVLAAAPNEAEDSHVAVAITMPALSRRREVEVRLSARAPAVDGYGRASQQGRGIEVNSSVARARERCLRWTCTRR